MFTALGNAEGFKHIISSFSKPTVANRFGDKGRSLRRQLLIKKKPNAKKKPANKKAGMVSSSRGFARRALVERSGIGIRING